MIHINNFLEKIKVLESRNERKFIMTTQEAKDLHADITKLLLALHELSSKKSNEITKIEINGDNW